jgi:hypothetical protein
MATRKIAAKWNPFARVGPPVAAVFTIGTEATNVINVGVQLKDGNGKNLTVRASVRAYLSDDSHGDNLIATVTSGAVAIGTDGVLIDSGNVAKKTFLLTSEANGHLDINMTEAGVKTVYLVIVLPDGTLKVSPAITWA